MRISRDQQVHYPRVNKAFGDNSDRTHGLQTPSLGCSGIGRRKSFYFLPERERSKKMNVVHPSTSCSSTTPKNSLAACSKSYTLFPHELHPWLPVDSTSQASTHAAIIKVRPGMMVEPPLSMNDHDLLSLLTAPHASSSTVPRASPSRVPQHNHSTNSGQPSKRLLMTNGTHSLDDLTDGGDTRGRRPKMDNPIDSLLLSAVIAGSGKLSRHHFGHGSGKSNLILVLPVWC